MDAPMRHFTEYAGLRAFDLGENRGFGAVGDAIEPDQRRAADAE